MSWLSWHEKSERLASDAHVCARRGERERALRLFAEAAEAESRALDELDVAKTRTLGITTVSAVSLWFKARQFSRAEQLALRWLSSLKLPQFAVDQARSLLQAVWETRAYRFYLGRFSSLSKVAKRSPEVRRWT